MARSLRFQYPAAIYHVMARRDGGKTVFENKDDCEVFFKRMLAEVKRNPNLKIRFHELAIL
jgi:hypothetical protein